MTSSSDRIRPILAVTFGNAAFLSALGSDAFLPMMVALADAFAVEIGYVQFGIAAFFFGGTVGQALVGPLADRFGRRPVLLTGIALFTLSAGLAVWAANIWVLIALRFLQGFGGYTGRIVVRAIIRDLYSRDVGTRMLSYTTMIGTTIPIWGPLIAAQLLHVFGWQAVFALMSAFGAFVFMLVLRYVDESLGEKDAHAVRPLSMLLNFVAIARNRVFFVYALLALAPPMGLIAFLTASAAVLIGSRGLTPGEYSVAFALVMATNTTAAYANARLVPHLGFSTMISIGTSICALAGAAMLALAALDVTTTAAVIGPMMIYMVGSVFVTNQALVGALVPFPDRAGAASSLIGIVQGLFSTILSSALGLFSQADAVPMAAILLAAGTSALLVQIFAARHLEAAKPRS